MARTLGSARHRRLTELLVQRREAAGLTQGEVAAALGRHQPFISNIESGERRIDMIELLDLAAVVGFDIHQLIDDVGDRPSE